MSTEAMAARMRAAGHSIQKDSQKSSPSCCVLIGKRADNGDQWETSFSIDDAKRAGIYNDRGPWGKYPSVMCYNRAMSMMFRQLTPDLSKGAGYTLDELKEIAGVEGAPPAKKVVMPVACVETISEEQAMELSLVFQGCAADYVEKVWQTLRKPPIGIEDLKDLPIGLFERIKGAAVRNRDAYQESLAVVEEVEDEERFEEMEA